MTDTKPRRRRKTTKPSDLPIQDFMTPMLFQYVVALCCARRNPNAVDITIGDYVIDAATGARRDVDVTVTTREVDGSLTAFKGYEVKREGTPLDVTDVEQLCMKFMDLPDITHRAIVSASGFTENAVKKAIAHKVQVFEKKEWIQPVSELIPELERMGAPTEAFTVRTMGLVWDECSMDILTPGGPDAYKWTADWRLLSREGAPHSSFSSLGDYFAALKQRSQNILWALPSIQSRVTPEISDLAEQRGAADTPSWDHTHTLDVIADEVFLGFGAEGLVQIVAAHLSGRLLWQVRKRNPQFFILRDVVTGLPYSGTAICEGPREGVYLGLVFAPGSRSFTVHPNIELTDRQRNAIRQLKLSAFRDNDIPKAQ